METSAVQSTNVVSFPSAPQKAKKNEKLPQIPLDKFEKGKQIGNNLKSQSIGSFIDERNIADSYKREIIRLEKALDELDVNDPAYVEKYDKITSELQEARENYAKFNDENRKFGLHSFKESLAAAGQFIKDIGKETLEFLLNFFMPKG